MKKALIALAILAFAIAAFILLLRTRPAAEQSEAPPVTVVVEVQAFNPRDEAIVVQSQGTVEARTRTSLIAEVSGQVIEVSPTFVAGGFFRRGELLLQVEDQDYRAAVSRAEASVAAARSALEQEKAQGDVARREYDRLSDSQRTGLRTPSLYLRQPQLQEAIARLESAEADLLQAQVDLSRTRITAPYDGMVSQKNTDIGQFVNTGSGLADIFAVDYAEVRLPIPESKLPWLSLPEAFTGVVDTGSSSGMGAEVTLVSRTGNTEQHWSGHLTRTEGVLDVRTRALFTVVQVEDPYGLYGGRQGTPLRIGTYVNAAITGRVLQHVYVLPRHTLQGTGMVWVTDQENRLRSRQVEVVTVNDDKAYVSGGLEPGDKVVITRLENPLNGMLVQANELPVTGIN